MAEEGEHQRFLRLEHLEAREGDNARNVAEDGDDEQEAAEGVFPAFQMTDGVHEERCARRKNDEAEQQHREAAFFGGESFFFHNSSLLMGSEVFLSDTKIISLCRTAVKRGTQKKNPPIRKMDRQALCLWRKMEKYRSDRKF